MKRNAEIGLFTKPSRLAMHRDRIKWNAKYRKGDYPTAPAGIVREFSRLASGRMALDLAAGNGRNALFLAEQGFEVDAVDISEAGLEMAAPAHMGIRPICADLDIFDIPSERYDLILNILYLNRRLFPQIREGLKTGGVLIFETLLEMPGKGDCTEHCRDYFLRPNELLHSFLSLRILHYHEGPDSGGDENRRLASLVGVRP
jgi:SAM-dependent methyltransferase